jgi:Mn-dependent DtxR family transcriptional regulator
MITERSKQEDRRMHLYKSGEDYLEAILVLQQKNGYVRSLDVAEYLNVKKPSVSHATGLLKEGGFLTMDGSRFLHLTKLGQEVAEEIYERHRVLTRSLIAIGVDPETAEEDACKIEHDVSRASFEKIKKHLEKYLPESAQ